MVIITRQTAKKCGVKELINGRYIKREGWEPSYVETSLGNISRTNLMAIIISKENNTSVVDDGTGMISIRSFEENKILQGDVGDIVLIIGRPRIYNNEIFVVPEIIKKIDSKWLELRKLELQSNKETFVANNKHDENPLEESKEEQPLSDNINDNILNKVKEMDKGNGVKIEEVISHFDSQQANNSLNKLIEEGEIFEIKPGVVKVL